MAAKPSLIRNAGRTVVAILACLASQAPADRSFAQVSAEDNRMPKAFFGAGLAASTNDARFRMRLYDDTTSWLWMLEAGIAVSRRVAVGVELVFPSAVTGMTHGRSFHEAGRQEERVLLGMVRVRTIGSARWGLDVVGGAGVLLQRHHREFAPCALAVDCASTIVEDIERTAPALAFGIDVPIRAVPHLAISPFMRVYVLRRGERREQFPEFLPWQYEWDSSTRVALGVTGRLSW